MNLARIRKVIVGAIGFAITLILLVPQDSIPEEWRPWIGLAVSAASLAGIYRVRNDQPRSREELAERVERIGESEHGPPARFPGGAFPELSPPGETEPETPHRRRPFETP